MNQLKELQTLLKALRLGETAEQLPLLLENAEKNDDTYATFLKNVMNYEKQRREEKKIDRHMKWATFPYHKTLEEFSLHEQKSLSKKQFKQLKELLWIEQLYNLILLGPPGVGKTHLAIGLGIKAIYQGYKVIFTTMGDLVQTLKTEEITRKSQTRMKRIRNADLVIIDDLMFMAMDQHEGENQSILRQFGWWLAGCCLLIVFGWDGLWIVFLVALARKRWRDQPRAVY